jgi:hypothetical protein
VAEEWEGDFLTIIVMARFMRAIQFCAERNWMARTSRAMTVRG